MSTLYCNTNSTAAITACCNSTSYTLQKDVCAIPSADLSPFMGCLLSHDSTLQTFCKTNPNSGARKPRLGFWGYATLFLALLGAVAANTAEDLIKEANSILGVPDVCNGDYDYICNITVLDYIPQEYANLSPSPTPRDIQRPNLTTYDNPFYISRVVNQEAVAALTGNERRKRQCSSVSYYLDEYINYQGGEWDAAWEPQCDAVAWSNAWAGTCSSISKSTSYSISLSVSWMKIITGKIGANWDKTSTGSTCIGVYGSCGCWRLWTSDKMIWSSGTMYHNLVSNGGCGMVTKQLLSRTDNIHTDAGKKDSNGLLIVTPGGSPCSDGPTSCSQKSSGWRC